jgi:hypothetical protein
MHHFPAAANRELERLGAATSKSPSNRQKIPIISKTPHTILRSLRFLLLRDRLAIASPSTLAIPFA